MPTLPLADDMQAMQEHANEAAGLLKSMSNPNRLMLMCALIGKELPVGAINALIPLSQSALSQHLAALRHTGLVQTRRESQTIFYSLAGDEAIKIIETLKSIYCPDL